jgi:putative PIN family toxin of toxin-antitoxin system
MRVVLDTNMLVSARIGKVGNPSLVLRYILQHGQEVEMLTSTALLTEVRRVFQYPRIKRKYHLTNDDIDLYVGTIEDVSTLIEVRNIIPVISDDPDDDQVLACALEGEADYIVSGDPHLLSLQQYEDMLIVPPRQFLSLLEGLFADDNSG